MQFETIVAKNRHQLHYCCTTIFHLKILSLEYLVIVLSVNNGTVSCRARIEGGSFLSFHFTNCLIFLNEYIDHCDFKQNRQKIFLFAFKRECDGDSNCCHRISTVVFTQSLSDVKSSLLSSVLIAPHEAI